MNKDKSEQQSQQGIIEGWEEKLREILKGIDTDDFEPDGWWETSTGAKFGAEKFKEVEKLFSLTLSQQAKKTRKETLEEVVEVIRRMPFVPSPADISIIGNNEYINGEADMALATIKKLQSLINKQ